MKLEINLADREEIAAAVPLLQMILTNTPTPSLYEEGRAALAADTRPPVHESSAAVIFGGAQPAAPLAPSTPPPATPGIVVPPPPANTAPTMPTLGAASSGEVASSVDLDSKGLPWDERIHAGSKAKVKDGSWRMKKELNPAHVAAVEAELRGRMSAGNAALPAAPTVPTPPPVSPVGASSPTITASPPAAPVADPAAVFGGAVHPAPEPTTFEQLMPRITAAVTAGLMPATAVGAACASQGLASVVMLQQSPQFVPLVWATLKQQYPGV